MRFVPLLSVAQLSGSCSTLARMGVPQLLVPGRGPAPSSAAVSDLGNMIQSASAPSALAECFADASSAGVVAIEASLRRGEKIKAMLLPEHSREASNLLILKSVGRAGLAVINASGSFDAARIQRYKDQAGAGRFDIAPEDRVMFEGVRYVIVYSHFSERASRMLGGRSAVYCDNRIEMKFWDVASGQLMATCEAKGTYASPDRYEGMDVAITAALLQAKVPGVGQ